MMNRTKNRPLFLQLPLTWHERNSKEFFVQRCPIQWAQALVKREHYLHQRVHDKAYPFAYSIHHSASGREIGVVILGTPHFTRLKELFGYPEQGLPTHWQVLLISRVWIDPEFQNRSVLDSKGRSHAFCVASCAIAQVIRQVNQDWLTWHPPRFPDQPYNLRLLVSYSDLKQGHQGIIYQASNFAYHGLSYSDKVSRHSQERRIAPLPLIRYFIPLRKVFDPLSQQTVRWSIPNQWQELQQTSKERLQVALHEVAS